jgi:hypothetical protein
VKDEPAVKFVNLSVPSAAGKLALTVRFLQRQRVDRSVALSQGALDGLAGLVVQAAVLVVTLPLIDIRVDPGERDESALVWVASC